METFDLAVVGGGPAGLSAAINASSEGLSVVLLNAEFQTGGQSKYSAAIENYLGFPVRISGQQLALRAEAQALKFGTVLKRGCAVNLILPQGEFKLIHYTCLSHPYGNQNSVLTNEVLQARAVIVACGLQFRPSGAEGEQKYLGHGVIPNADKNLAPHYKGKRVLVVGGGNSAGQAALHWARFCDVKIACKRKLETSMSRYLEERIEATNISVLCPFELKQIRGNGKVESVLIQSPEELREVLCDLVLLFVGAKPNTDFLKPLCECDEDGYLIRANLPGVFLAGDCRSGSLKRISAAVGDGATAVGEVHKYLSEVKK